MVGLPHNHIAGEIVGIPPVRIIDSDTYPQLAHRICESQPIHADTAAQEGVRRFLENRLALEVDIDAVAQSLEPRTQQLAEGLATWVPRIEHDSGVFRVQATAGAGKTQLALALLREAASDGLRSAYVCFNQPLTDRMAILAPPHAQEASFHELCWECASSSDQLPDWSAPDAFPRLESLYLD